MQLHVDDRGHGSRTALLVHGLTGSSESWHRVVPLLVAHGYRVLAVDLPGHGRSPRDHALTIPRAARAVAASVAGTCGTAPDVAIGHSLGGLVLAAAVELGVLHPRVTVSVDAPAGTRGGWDRDETAAEYAEERRGRTVEGLRATRPAYGEQDRVVEARAARRFDPDTAAALAAGPGCSFPPPPGSIVVRADPSAYVDDDRAAGYRDRGVDVRSIPGAAHTVWYSHFDAFVAALPEVFGPS
ncbi:alpha/beta fold hydrolase [Curtobacterium caseinilyticum]|uniref:Alpha/beta fold hydrolase n=1 Tax=Curtobacterium caseinilyticum TaxID=3055137 RepID=A0ABT7TRS7_9MICO|nr:alpha/beta fold hydrolase [Curtobacterium caseinilyticum]MDM7892314.1 alpha/beta fold hydrolase [Curtobacterium caseinilyticum]